MRTYWNKVQWIALALVLLMGVIWEFYPLSDASERLHSLPLSGPGFAGYDVPINETERAVFLDNHLVKRIYQVAGQHFFLSIVDGTHHRSAVHDPTLCFQGEGWSIEGRRPLRLVNGEGEILTLKRDEESREVLLWFSDGKQRYSSLIRYWYQTMVRRLSLGRSGEEPVRVIVQPVGKDPVEWNKLLRDFYPLWAL